MSSCFEGNDTGCPDFDRLNLGANLQTYYEAVDQLGGDAFARDQEDQEEHVRQCQGAAGP